MDTICITIRCSIAHIMLGLSVACLAYGCIPHHRDTVSGDNAESSAAIVADAPATTNTSAFVVVGYLPDYRLHDWNPTSLGPLTDLIYFGIRPPADGVISSDMIDQDALSHLREMSNRQGCRLLLCVGGGNRSDGFAALAASDATRKRFVEGISRWCVDNGFAGIDYDWEHPRGKEQLADYTALIIESKHRFEKVGLLTTIAQSTWQDLGAPIYAAVDRVHLMSYNHPYPQSTMMKSWIDVQRMRGWSCPPEKLTLGVPFYGRNRAHEAKPYRDLIQGRQVDPTLDIIDGYAFNGPATLQTKARFAIDNDFAGIMIWELGQDAHGNTSLLNALKDVYSAQGQD